MLKVSSVRRDALLIIMAVTWDDGDVTLRKKNFKDFLICHSWTKDTLTHNSPFT